jgi:hypothetical protein
VRKFLKLIEAEIARTRFNIERHKTSGVYVENCKVWGHHLEAYETILRLITEPQRRPGKSS